MGEGGSPGAGNGILWAVSRRIAQVEVGVASILSVLITALILLNVITRSIGRSIYWVDEAAIAAMVWMAFLGASASLHYRTAISVTLFPDALPQNSQKVVTRLVDVVVLIFSVFLLWLSFDWFDPIGLIQSGFSFDDFSSETLNFIYSETTATLGISKFWLWLIVPLFAIQSAIHALANLLATNPLAPPSAALVGLE